MNKITPKMAGRDSGLDLALVRDPAAAFRMSPAAVGALDETSRGIIEIIRSYPWTAMNDSVTAAALFSFGIPDSLIEYIFELEVSLRVKAA